MNFKYGAPKYPALKLRLFLQKCLCISPRLAKSVPSKPIRTFFFLLLFIQILFRSFRFRSCQSSSPDFRRYSNKALRPELQPLHNIRHDFFLKSTRTSKVPTIEIFSAPPPITSLNSRSLQRSIKSWTNLRPRPQITLLGRGRGLANFAEKFGARHDSLVDHSFLGRPLFNSLIHRVNRSDADIAVLINSDIILLDDFIPVLHKLYSQMSHFFATGSRYDFDSFSPHEHEDQRAFAKRHGVIHNYGGMDFWAWTTGGPRLVEGNVLSFVFARGKYDNWFVHEVISANARPVIDVSESVYSVHVRHSYKGSAARKSIALAFAPEVQFNDLNDLNPGSETSNNFWSTEKSSNFEVFVNTHLSLKYGSYATGLGTTLHAPWKAVACFEQGGVCLLKRERPGACFCEYSASVPRVQISPVTDKFGRPKTTRLSVSYDTLDQFELTARVTRESVRHPRYGLPLTLLDALATVMKNGTVMLTAVNYAYRNMMMNWICHLRRVGINNYLVAALDEEVYRFAILRGVAVYFEDSFNKGVESRDVGTRGEFGSNQFRKLTKMKTRVVTRILRLGYDVLWSDCDIVYFRNPIPYVMSVPGDIVVQSNAPDGEAANGWRRLNSGFYLARSSLALIEAMDRIISFEDKKTEMTEQPCFYDVVCGHNGRYRHGECMCIHADVIVKFLEREEFPNGLTKNMWNVKDGKISSMFPKAKILHNNWVVGVDGKQDRMLAHGYYIYSEHEDLCMYENFQVPGSRRMK